MHDFTPALKLSRTRSRSTWTKRYTHSIFPGISYVNINKIEPEKKLSTYYVHKISKMSRVNITSKNHR
jgi:hypothetical protein